MLAEIVFNNQSTSTYGSMPQKVYNEEIYMITIITDNENNTPTSLNDLEHWYTDFPNPLVPVLADTATSDYKDVYIEVAHPSIYVFDENMQLVAGPMDGDHFAAVDFIDNL